MLALSTYLGHSKVADTYWYLEGMRQRNYRSAWAAGAIAAPPPRLLA
jgi:hypothetical protein